MNTLRTRIEKGFENFGRLVYRNRIKCLFLMALLIAALVYPIQFLRPDNSNEMFFKKGDPTLVAFDDFREQFGRDEMVLVAVTPPEVFDAAFLRKLKEFHKALEDEVPFLKEVTSLINVRDTRGEGDQLIVGELLEEIPETPRAMADLREYVLASKFYPNLYISQDGTLTSIILETIPYSPGEGGEELSSGFDDSGDSEPSGKDASPKALSDKENGEVVAAVKEVASRFETPEFPIHVTGSPVIVDYFNQAIGRDVGLFMTLAFVSFSIFLLILFRRLSGSLLTLLIVMLSLLSTLGLLAAFGRPFTSVTSILPSFMMSVGVGSSVHILAIFYRKFKELGDKEEAIAYTFGHSGLPVAMTSITTAIGLLSFATADMAPVADLGIFGGAGVMIILVFTLVLLPALISILPLRPTARFGGKSYGKGMDRLLIAIANFATSRAWAVVIVSGVVVGVSAYGFVWQGFAHSLVRWLPHESDVRKSIELLDEKMNGAFNIELVADTREENGLYNPVVMEKIQEFSRFAEAYQDVTGQRIVGKSTSIANVLQETHKALNGNDPAYYRIPRDRELIAQELLLFENSGSDDMERLVDSQFSKARISTTVRQKDASEYVGFVNDLQNEADRIFAGLANVTVTGTIRLFTGTVQQLMINMVKSYTIAGVAITVLMILMLGSFRVGLLSMLPNLAPIIITLGLMGWIGIKLDMSNMLLGTVAIGLAVDDTIHFFHNFRNYYAKHGDTALAVRETMLSTGRAMMFTTLVLVTGFWLFMFASLINLIQFGFLIGVTMIIALLADILLAPAMMELITRTQRGRTILARWGKV